MCGAPHLRIHSSFRSAVFDSACQLRVSFLFRLRRCRVPAGALCMRLVPVLLHRTFARGSNTMTIDSRPGDACQHLVVKSTTRAYSEESPRESGTSDVAPVHAARTAPTARTPESRQRTGDKSVTPKPIRDGGA